MMSTPPSRGRTIPQAFRNALQAHGDEPVILCDGASWTFLQLDKASNRVAAELIGQGILAGDRVGLYCTNSPQFVAAYLGILKTGAAVVPINVLLSPREIAYILEDAGVRGLLFHAMFAAVVDQLRDMTSLLEFTREVGDSDAALTGGESGPGMADATSDIAVDPAEHLAAILYTSGTTGRPKGAMLTHRNLLFDSAGVAKVLKLQPGRDRIFVVLPMFHAFAATVGMLTPLVHGLGLVIADRFEPKLVTDTIARYGATVFLGVPGMFNLLLRLGPEGIAQWRSVRFCVSGGAAMPAAVMAAFEERFSIPVLEGDGPTECSPVTCVNPLEGPRKPGSVGLPLPGVEMRIAGAEGETLTDGQHGEVCVRGANVMKGYWGLEESTRESFFGEWFRTGDLGYRDGDGYFYLVDRIKDLIITNGMNVYPRVVEEALYRHPEVLEAAVVGEPHALHGEIPVAFVVARPGAQPEPSALRDWCKTQLGRHEVPRRVLVCESLPRNAAGKILKRELRRHGEVERGVEIPAQGG
jgi:long-chain acyl-CoA synthetase